MHGKWISTGCFEISRRGGDFSIESSLFVFEEESLAISWWIRPWKLENLEFLVNINANPGRNAKQAEEESRNSRVKRYPKSYRRKLFNVITRLQGFAKILRVSSSLFRPIRLHRKAFGSSLRLFSARASFSKKGNAFEDLSTRIERFRKEGDSISRR